MRPVCEPSQRVAPAVGQRRAARLERVLHSDGPSGIGERPQIERHVSPFDGDIEAHRLAVAQRLAELRPDDGPAFAGIKPDTAQHVGQASALEPAGRRQSQKPPAFRRATADASVPVGED